MKYLTLFIFMLLCPEMDANNIKNKQITAKRSSTTIKIDGIIGADEWGEASTLDKFVELRPNPGQLETDGHKTVTYLLYNDEGIYFAGVCHEESKDSIATELIGRDGFGNNDFIGIIFDTYKDNLNAFEYFITPLNEQMDAKVSPNTNGDPEDFSWNSVWQSATQMTDEGWSFEIFIPFSAIRFSKKEVQDWGLNITRRRVKTGEQFFWNELDPNVNGFLTQEGYWTGLQKIKPPLRLQLSPYISFYSNHFPSNDPNVSNYTSQINGGLDLKLGLNQAFTLDATLIPDFGQVQSDARVLNLTPFEVRFNENRAFFTEGTELFSKGNLFYSRRIGGNPFYYYDAYNNLSPTENVIKNPSETKLLNASKISGRTENGLGIGILNAITKPTYALIEDTETGQRREVLTDPLTNYNVFVLDKTMKNNSSVSFVNTSVLRNGSAYDANVSALLFDLNDASNSWNVGGQFSTSQLYNSGSEKNSFGYSHNIYAGKTSGTLRFNVWQELSDTKFTSNDLGYFTNNNYMTQGVWIGIRKPNPKGWRNNMNLNLNTSYSRLFAPIGTDNPMFQAARINFNANFQHKKLFWFGTFNDITMAENDFYEPRVAGKYFRRGSSMLHGGWFESNSAKKWSVYTEYAIRRAIDFYNGTFMDFSINPAWRASEKFSLRLGINWRPRYNSMGFISFQGTDPVFAKRKINTFENSIRGKYNFTNRMGLTMVVRHYMSAVDILQTYDIGNEGQLVSNELSPKQFNRTANFFNVDMVYTWQIAQGSFINVVWKNAIGKFDSVAKNNYLTSLKETLQEDQNNNISFKLIYFLDYNTIKGKS